MVTPVGDARGAPGLLGRLRDFLQEGLWRAEPAAGVRSRFLHLLQFCTMVAQGFMRDRLMLRASALTYFTVLSLVPILAVAVSIVSAVGVGSERFVEWIVGTLAAVSPEAEARIKALIEGASFARMGTIGAVTLFVTTVLAIGSIEQALNSIWGVRRARSWARRFPDYLAVLVVAPLLMATAVSLTTALRSAWLVQRLLEDPAFAEIYHLGFQYAPAALLSLAFAFLYWFLPNTSVRPVSALLGGIPAGVLTVLAQRVFIDFGVGAARANAFFGAFGALALLFVWIYVFWAIVLMGAEIAFAHQNLASYRREVRGRRAGPAEREAIGLRIALWVARGFREGARPLDADALSDALLVPVRTVRGVLDDLLGARIVAESSDSDHRGGFLLGRPAEKIAVTDVIRVLRGQREPADGDDGVDRVVERVLEDLEEGASRGIAGLTLADLLGDLSSTAPTDRVDPSGASR